MTDDRSVALDLPGFEGLVGVELVQRTPLFRTLSFDETVRLFKIAVTVTKAAGEVVIEEDALSPGLFFLQRGAVEVRRGERVLGTCGPGELLGEMSLIEDVLTSSRVVATEDTALLLLPRAAFEHLMAQDAAFAAKVYRAFCRTLSDRLRRANDLLPADARHANEVR